MQAPVTRWPPLARDELENNTRDFEISSVPKSIIDWLSKRHQEIDEETKEPVEKEGLRGNVKALRKQVAHDERCRKMKTQLPTDCGRRGPSR